MKLIRFYFLYLNRYRIIPKNADKAFGGYIYKLITHHEALHPGFPPVPFIPGIQPATRFFGKTLYTDRENTLNSINAGTLAYRNFK
jgi:hypothetical protein